MAHPISSTAFYEIGTPSAGYVNPDFMPAVDPTHADLLDFTSEPLQIPTTKIKSVLLAIHGSATIMQAPAAPACRTRNSSLLATAELRTGDGRGIRTVDHFM